MKLKQLAILASAILLLATGAYAQKKVHTIGDSTMAPYDPETTVTRGWGMYLQQFLYDVTVVNYAKGGRDARGGYNELWQTVKKNMSAGDYVIIQFGHNDEKNGGMDGVELYNYYIKTGDTEKANAVDQRGTIPSTTYKQNLKKIVDEVIELGGNPILVAPICRAQWNCDKVRRSGRHDLGDSFSKLTANGPTENNSVPQDDHTMDFPYHMQQLADSMNVPFIDLTTASAELYESYGSEKTATYLFDGQGGTHLCTTGAVLVARKCAELMKNQGILLDNIVLPTDITTTPADGNFGESYKGQTLQKEYTLSGFGLSPENGTVSITTTSGIYLSTNKSDWSSSLSIDYQASTLIQTFYVQLTLTEIGETTGMITIQQGDKAVEIPVSATAVSLEGGSEVTAYWRLESSDECALTGPATVVPQSWSGMYVQRYANPNANTVWPEWTGFAATRKTQRNLIVGDIWPADEIDDNPERYIEFGVQANVGSTLKIDSLGMFVCGCGGNGMMCHIYYSTDNFQTRKTIFAPTSLPANNMQAVQARPVITLDEGERLLIRVYPWYTSSASGKTICLSDVTIHGRAYEADNSNNITLPTDSALNPAKAVLDSSVVAIDSTTLSADGGEARFSLYNTASGAAYRVSFDAVADAEASLHLTLSDKATDVMELDKVVAVAAGSTLATYDVITYQLTGGLKAFSIAFDGKVNVNNIRFTPLTDDELCKLTTDITPSTDAGAVAVVPTYSYFAPGTEVTLTATANKGYLFEAWVDADGQPVSASSVYTFTIDKNTALTARFITNELINNIPTDDANPFTMENGTLTSAKPQANFGSDHHIDYMYNNDYATYTLQSLKDVASYEIAFTAGTKQSDVSLNFKITDMAGTEVCNQSVAIENNGDWSASSRAYSLRTGAMPAGKYTMVITFNSVGGNGTTANVNNITFTEVASTGVDTVNVSTEPLSTTYYTVDGRRLPGPVRGVNIVCRLQSDGSVSVAKLIVK